MSALAVDVSSNAKIGPASATYVSQSSCPTSCPLRGAGCYAESGPMAIHTRRLNKANPTASPVEVARAEAAAIEEKISGRLDLRLHVVGDCATDEAAEIVSKAALAAMKPGRKVWAYTHAAADVKRESWGAVSVLASGETPEQIKAAQAKGYATAMIVSKFKQDGLYEEDGLKILPCPNQTRDVTCVECRLCMDDTRLHEKGITIGFTPHGSRFKVVQRLLPTLQ